MRSVFCSYTYGYCSSEAVCVQPSYISPGKYFQKKKKEQKKTHTHRGRYAHLEICRMISEVRLLRKNSTRHLNQEHSQKTPQSFLEVRCSGKINEDRTFLPIQDRGNGTKGSLQLYFVVLQTHKEGQRRTKLAQICHSASSRDTRDINQWCEYWLP